MNKIQNKIRPKFDIIPVILAGGVGSRLWPLSRACYPKQFLKLDERNNFSMLQNTFLRIDGLKKLQAPIIICNEEYRFIVAEQMREIGIIPRSIILEPESKNTAPAITLASLNVLGKENKDAVLLILSADHIIEDNKILKESIKAGYELAMNNRLVTFGISPIHPETGYGYIESFEELSINNISSEIKRFIEKPPIELAEKLIKNKHFSWNSGIFMFKSSLIIKEIENYHPEIIRFCKESLKDKINDLDFQRISPDKFKECPNISIDIAVMENTKLGTVTQLNAGWSDVGNWKTLWEKSAKDIKGNKQKGKTLLMDSKNCYLRSENRLTVGIGLEDLAIIETRDAVLVANINQVQNVKNCVTTLDEMDYAEGKVNTMIYRPWGNFTTIEEGQSWKVKKIAINPGARISLQLHNHRSEHWVVVSGKANVEINGKISEINENESIYVPKGHKHRLSNFQDYPLVIIEIQSGSYLGEDDIVRFNDIYGRN